MNQVTHIDVQPRVSCKTQSSGARSAEWKKNTMDISTITTQSLAKMATKLACSSCPACGVNRHTALRLFVAKVEVGFESVVCHLAWEKGLRRT